MGASEAMKRSIIQDEPVCFFCGTTNQLELHHVFGGANRKWSEKYKITVYLCKRHHMEAHSDKATRRILQVRGQMAWEERYGNTSDFMAVFGRNFIFEDEDPAEAETRQIDPIVQALGASEKEEQQ